MASWIRSWGNVGVWSVCLALLTPLAVLGQDGKKKDPTKRGEAPPKALEFALFEPLLDKHRDMTYDQLLHKLAKRSYLDKLSFDPAQAAYFERVKNKLQMNQAEIDLYKKNGFVSLDLKVRHTFASAYYQIYARDLPVLVTSDSIMHALHRSYDDILMELEMTLFTWTMEEILEASHKRLETWATDHKGDALGTNLRDVDLYLTVARNLLAGAGAPERDDGKSGHGEVDIWNGQLLVKSCCGNDDEARARLKDIQSLKIQVPFQDEPTRIYGGERFVDYSQFRPRGHYTKVTALKRYFRTMMWLGRADCGWNVLPPHPDSRVRVNADRELTNAVLFTQLLEATGESQRLKAVDDIINFMVGRSDNLTVFNLRDLLKEAKIQTPADALNADARTQLKKSLAEGKHARPLIRSQSIVSPVNSPDPQIPPPAVFQVFGQRFIIDSFVLSQVVYDSIRFENRKIKRMMPQGLDAMAALGNDEAVRLLKKDLEEYKYSANLMACREFVDALEPAFWKDNLYNLWLECLRTLDDDLTKHKNFPEVMRTRAWQLKQLQTQLGSWAELRHDTILYAKQSYTAVPDCEYPVGYVEPNPEFFARVRYFADEAGRLFAQADYSTSDKNRAAQLQQIKARQIKFFKDMAQTIGKLEELAKKELKAQAFSAEDAKFLKKTVDRRGGGSGPPRYDGWYCSLFYRLQECAKWVPTVADVHTDPQSKSCLEVAVGDINLCVIAIDNEKDRMTFVGPIFSYYEFRHPVADRLTDERWQGMIQQGKTPPRPDWVRAFQAPPR
jgi:hypothetical protein